MNFQLNLCVQYLTLYHCNPDIGILLREVFWWITSPFARVCWLGWRSRNASEIPLEHTLRKTKRGNLKMRIFKAMLLGCHPQNQEGAAGMIGIWWLSEVRRSHRNQPSKEGWDHWSFQRHNFSQCIQKCGNPWILQNTVPLAGFPT